MIGTDVRTTINEINSFERTSHSSYLLSIITPTTQSVNEIQVLKIVIPDSNIDRNLIQNYFLNANKSSTGLFSLFNENQRIKIKSLGKDFSTDLISTLYYLISNTTLNTSTSATTTNTTTATSGSIVALTGLLNYGGGDQDQGFSVVQLTEKQNGGKIFCVLFSFTHFFYFSINYLLFFCFLFFVFIPTFFLFPLLIISFFRIPIFTV